jgi:hypothetical protein
MIPQPMRFVHGQALRPETLNQVLDTMRRMTPIAGPGILLHHSPNGTTFSVKHTSAPKPPAFNHPFKVTLTKNANGTYTAKVLQGRFFTLAEGIAEQVHFALEGLEATDGGWTAETCSYGDALYIKKTDDTYTLEWGTDTTNALYIIASIEGDRYATPPRLEVKQHLLSDLYFLEASGAVGGLYTPEVYEGATTDTAGAKSAHLKFTNENDDKDIKDFPLINLKGASYVPSRFVRGAGGSSGLEEGVYYIYFKNSQTGTELGPIAVGKLDGKDGTDGADGEDGKDATLPTAQSLTVVTSVSYNASTHKLTYKKRTVTGYFTSLGTESTSDVFTATPHSGEHS